MREIGSLSQHDQALRLVSYLQSHQIRSKTEPEDERWVIWVENDDQRQQATKILEEFQQNPDAQHFRDADAAAQREARKSSQPKSSSDHSQPAHRPSADSGGRWNRADWQRSPVTQILTFLCVFVVLTCTDWSAGQKGSFGLPRTCNDSQSALLNALWMEEPAIVTIMGSPMRLPVEPHLWETLKAGEVWRLVTPILIHLDVLHIVLNLMWLRSLGTAIELARGSWRFLCLVLIVAVTSCLTQYFWSGPRFGGMSGVVFGLIGYMWMKGRTQPRHGLGLTQEQVVYSIAWLLLCMTGAFGPIANGAHVGGFITGILLGLRRSAVETVTGKS